MLKRCFVLFLIVIMLFTISSCIGRKDHLDKGEISKLIAEHKETLLELIESGDLEDAENIKGIKSAGEVNGFVHFDCGGRGLSVSGVDYGFYYSPEDEPTGIFSWTPSAKLREESGGWVSTDEHGGNRYYTEKICECFYYFEAAC